MKKNIIRLLKVLPLFVLLAVLMSSCTPRLAKPTFRAPNRIAEFDSLIVNLQANNYDMEENISLPDLYWDDIPFLLEIAESDQTLNTFPRNPSSSYAQYQAYMGIVAMWMIESIRLDNPYRAALDNQPFPSNNLILVESNSVNSTDFRPNTFIELRKAADAYKRWWKLYPLIGIDALKKIDPLAGTGLKWN
ncbi:MAG: DUF4943 family protein [Bacteroidota bacterium]